MTLHAVEEYSHPESDQKLLLVVERDGDTQEKRRKFAAETLRVNNDAALTFVVRQMTMDEIDDLEEFCR